MTCLCSLLLLTDSLLLYLHPSLPRFFSGLFGGWVGFWRREEKERRKAWGGGGSGWEKKLGEKENIFQGFQK